MRFSGDDVGPPVHMGYALQRLFSLSLIMYAEHASRQKDAHPVSIHESSCLHSIVRRLVHYSQWHPKFPRCRTYLSVNLHTAVETTTIILPVSQCHRSSPGIGCWYQVLASVHSFPPVSLCVCASVGYRGPASVPSNAFHHIVSP